RPAPSAPASPRPCRIAGRRAAAETARRRPAPASCRTAAPPPAPPAPQPTTQPRLLFSSASILLTALDDDGAAFYHPSYFVDNHVDIGERVAFDGDDVGEIAGRERAERLLLAEQRRRHGGRGGKRLRRRHPGADEPRQLTCVLTKHRVDRIGAHRQFDARLDRAPRRFEVLLDVG